MKYSEFTPSKNGRGKYCMAEIVYICGDDIAMFVQEKNYSTIILKSGAEMHVTQTTDEIIDILSDNVKPNPKGKKNEKRTTTSRQTN